MTTPNTPEPYSSRAWLLDGPICSLAGVLSWDGEVLEFIGFGAAGFGEKGLGTLLESFGQSGELAKEVMKGEPATVFTATASDLSGYKFPWYSFKKGVHLELLGRTVKFSLIQPQNTKLPYKLVGVALSEYLASRSIAYIPAEKADGKQWETIFEALKA